MLAYSPGLLRIFWSKRRRFTARTAPRPAAFSVTGSAACTCLRSSRLKRYVLSVFPSGRIVAACAARFCRSSSGSSRAARTCMHAAKRLQERRQSTIGVACRRTRGCRGCLKARRGQTGAALPHRVRDRARRGGSDSGCGLAQGPQTWIARYPRSHSIINGVNRRGGVGRGVWRRSGRVRGAESAGHVRPNRGQEGPAENPVFRELGSRALSVPVEQLRAVFGGG